MAYPKGAPQRWYHRTFNEVENKYDWAKSSASFKHDISLQEKTRENALFLSVGPQFNHPQLTSVFEWFKNNLRFLPLSDTHVNPEFTASLLVKPAHRNRIFSLLKSADIGIIDAKVQEVEMSMKEQFFAPLKKFKEKDGLKEDNRFEISLSHKAEGLEPVPLNFENEESAGTRRFFALIGPWMDILDNGYTVFVDEIETSLHPILVKELLKFLLCSEYNPKGAQVIFTTHNPVLLDNTLMRRDQIWFTEKSPAGTTHLYALTDYQPRKDEALAKGYLAGRYGAIPFLPDGLKL